MPSRSHSGMGRLAACGAAASAMDESGSAQNAHSATTSSLVNRMQPPSWLQRDDLIRGTPASRVNTYAQTNAFRKKESPADRGGLVSEAGRTPHGGVRSAE